MGMIHRVDGHARTLTLAIESSLYRILQIASVTIFEKEPILQLIEAFDSQSELLDNSKQLILFDLEQDTNESKHSRLLPSAAPKLYF
jgi:hypothetical protein